MANLQLPSSIVSKIDISRILREMESLEEYMRSARIRVPGTIVALPRLSLLLELTARVNNIDLAVDDQRHTLSTILVDIRDHAPTLHVSFAANPSAAIVEKLVQWFRTEMHPYALVQSGLQPGLAAGCILRTPNRVFDLSLRRRLNERKGNLLEALKMEAPK